MRSVKLGFCSWICNAFDCCLCWRNIFCDLIIFKLLDSLIGFLNNFLLVSASLRACSSRAFSLLPAFVSELPLTLFFTFFLLFFFFLLLDAVELLVCDDDELVEELLDVNFVTWLCSVCSLITSGVNFPTA